MHVVGVLPHSTCQLGKHRGNVLDAVHYAGGDTAAIRARCVRHVSVAVLQYCHHQARGLRRPPVIHLLTWQPATARHVNTDVVRRIARQRMLVHN